MLAERPTPAHTPLRIPAMDEVPLGARLEDCLLLRLQSYYWLREGVAYGVGLAFVELGLWAMPTELGCRWLAWGEALLEDALQASCCCTALAVARSPWTTDPAGTPRWDSPQPPTLRWGTLGSALLHALVMLLWIWQGSRPVPELEQRIPITLLELPPEPELVPEQDQDTEQETEPEPEAPPEPRAEPDPLPPPPPAAPGGQAEPLPEPLPPPEPDPLSLAELGLQTPSPTPTSTPTPPPTPTSTPTPTPPPTPAPTPPPTPVPTATPPPTPTPTPVPTPAAVAQQPSSPAVVPASPAPAGTPVPRLTPLIQGIPSHQRDGVLSSDRSGVSSSAATATSPQATAPPSGTTASTSPPSPPPVVANPQPDTLAQPIPGRNAPPQYPPQARRLNQQGQVMLRAKVDPQGQVQQVEILSSSGFPALDSAAQQAVQQWQFSPALKNNVPIESWVTVPIQFALN